jgi:pimeloyl-ACP methyl ester carboxylesterase
VIVEATPSPEPSPSAVEPRPAIFEAAPCPFDLPAGQIEGESVDCGYVVVPEDWADPQSGTLRLAVAVFHHPDGEPEPDPILYLEGGPGGSSLEALDLSFDQAYAPLWAANRDLIFFDQRGVGLSQPALDCPQVDELALDLLDYEVDGQPVSREASSDLVFEALQICSEDLRAKADLTAYNTAQNATDVDAVWRALGYDQINLWGVSYGTRLALEVMRRYPAGVRSVVLDSVYPPDVDLYLHTPANADRAFDRLFDACAADEACRTAYPDLREVVFDTVERLNQEPASFQVTHAFTGEQYDALLTGDDLLAFLFQFLYYTEIIPSLPEILYAASEGEFSSISLLAGVLLAQQEIMSQGMTLSVQCHDEMAFSSLEEYEAALAEHPELTGLFEGTVVGKLGYRICQSWGSGAAEEVVNEPVVSDIPALILAGEYDPITPPEWAWQAADTLENAYAFLFPGVGHGASVSSDCATEMMLDFWRDPVASPDDGCIGATDGVQFLVPGESQATVTLEPYTSASMGFSGVVPEGWDEVAPGIFSRGETALDAAVLLLQAGPVSAEELLVVMTRQLGLEADPESAGQREANDLVWTLYELDVQGLAIDIGLAEEDGMAYIVLLQSMPAGRETLYETVFVPAIDALVPAP